LKITAVCLNILSLILHSGCSTMIQCQEKINLIPMYGKEKKCIYQLEGDEEFLINCDKKFKDRKEAARFYINRGWSYFHMSQLDTSMMRFNEAWLLDSTNADIYLGFGSILGTNKQFKESIPFFERSIKINPDNPKAYEGISASYGQLFFETKDIKYLNFTIDNLKKAIQLAPNNASAYGQLTAAYSYLLPKDSARKYMEITDKLNPNEVNPEVRDLLKEK
jgi:tetratricopeptide (TPR) repeat protein